MFSYLSHPVGSRTPTLFSFLPRAQPLPFFVQQATYPLCRKRSRSCWSTVPRSNHGLRRGGGDCLTTPTTCPGEEEHVLQLRGSCNRKDGTRTHTRRDRLPLFRRCRGWECWASAIQYRRRATRMSALKTARHCSFLEPSIRLESPLPSSASSTNSLLVSLLVALLWREIVSWMEK